MSADVAAVKRCFASLPQMWSKLGPGFLVCATVAMSAEFLAGQSGVPAMLLALLLGIAFNFLAADMQCVPGIDFTAKKVLRFGVALLGARVSVDLLMSLGSGVIALLATAIVCTISFGVVCARLLGRDWSTGVLTGGAVAICGASAAMAIAAVLPRNRDAERNLLFTILSVTMLSTIAMIVYPLFTDLLGLNHHDAGVFLGGTIHDVAQVVGAGFSVSEETGETATLVKLIRVTMLAPVVLVFSLAFRDMRSNESATPQRAPIIPGFVLGFLVLAALNSFAQLPPFAVAAVSDASRWALLFGIAAVGVKTSIKNVVEVGRTAMILIVAETLFLAVFVLIGMRHLG
jgi:uncharacterized integral membrane protein (TIGR00698 family)